ncbi:MAG: LptF/LptG family permease, partial [Phycisphaerae bacterium]
MFTVLDRYILRSLLVNYLITLGVMISLYVVLDMFVNMDEFTEQNRSVVTVISNIADYYAPNVFLFFAQLSSVITLFACVATIARLRKQNEVTAILASGVSLYRVAAPIIAFGLATTALLVIDTEWVIPSVAHKLARDHDDVDGQRAYEVLFLRDRNGALLSAARFHPKRHDLSNLLVFRRDDRGAITETLEADHAVWKGPDNTRPYGRWCLQRGRRTTRVFTETATLGPREDKRVTYPEEYETDLSPDVIQLRQAEGWMRYLSLSQLRDLQADESADLAAIVRGKHARIAAPIIGVVMLLLGLPFFLDRSPANVLSDAGKCVLACGSCYVVAFVSQSVRPESPS